MVHQPPQSRRRSLCTSCHVTASQRGHQIISSVTCTRSLSALGFQSDSYPQVRYQHTSQSPPRVPQRTFTIRRLQTRRLDYIPVAQPPLTLPTGSHTESGLSATLRRLLALSCPPKETILCTPFWANVARLCRQLDRGAEPQPYSIEHFESPGCEKEKRFVCCFGRI